MDNGTETALERAFAIARSGKFLNVTEVRAQLAREGFVTDQIRGRTLSRQLTEIMRTVRKADDANRTY